jgi:H+/Cl- antiporter ClcA
MNTKGVKMLNAQNIERIKAGAQVLLIIVLIIMGVFGFTFALLFIVHWVLRLNDMPCTHVNVFKGMYVGFVVIVGGISIIGSTIKELIGPEE